MRIGVLPRDLGQRLEPVVAMPAIGGPLHPELERAQGITRRLEGERRLGQVLRQRDRTERTGDPRLPGREFTGSRGGGADLHFHHRRAGRCSSTYGIWTPSLSTIRTSGEGAQRTCECASAGASSGSTTSPGAHRGPCADTGIRSRRPARRAPEGLQDCRPAGSIPASAPRPGPRRRARPPARRRHASSRRLGPRQDELAGQRDQRQRDGEPDERGDPVEAAERREIVEEALECRYRDERHRDRAGRLCT